MSSALPRPPKVSPRRIVWAIRTDWFIACFWPTKEEAIVDLRRLRLGPAFKVFPMLWVGTRRRRRVSR